MNDIFKKIIIMSDFDGTYTLYIQKNGVPQKNLDAIKRFEKLGGHFTFCTGRLPSIFKQLYPDFSSVCNAPLAMCNGGLLFDAKKDEVISSVFLDGEKAEKVICELREKFGDNIESSYFFDPEGKSESYQPGCGKGRGWYKFVNIFKSEEKTLEAKDYLIGKYGDEYNFFRSFNTVLEALDKSVSKEMRIDTLKDYVSKETGIDKSELICCCIGDYENDTSMLKAADYSFCPENAIPYNKSICDYVVCDCFSGAISEMIDVIEHNIINR